MKIVEDIQKYTDKNFGVGVMIDANMILEREKIIVPISPAIDVGLGGGVPEGTWVILSGNPKVGKTTTALKLAANAQALDKFVYYYNIEGRIKKRDFEGVHNLDPSKLKVIESTQGKILTAEEYLEHAIYTLKNHPKCVMILDSTSALCTEKEFTEKITPQHRHQGPKLLASFCRQMGNVVPVQDSIVILIQHLITDTSGKTYMPSYLEDGGKKVQFQVDVKLRCTSTQKWVQGEEQIGQVIKWHSFSSPLRAPGVKIESYLRYGYGLDEAVELTSLGADFGLIEKSGSWYKINEEKMQGEQKVADYLRDNVEYAKTLYQQIMTMV